MKRILYLGYYLKTLDWEKFWRFFRYVRVRQGIPRGSLLLDIFGSSLKYNISLLEYFQFHFYKLDTKERATYAGTGCMYEYQLIMNPKSSRACLDDKLEFYRRYGKFIRHKVFGIGQLENTTEAFEALLANPSGKVVLKYSHGQCGWQVEIHDADFFKEHDLLEYMRRKGFDLAEEYIVQHPELMALSPSGVNTVRVITQLNAVDEVEFLGARLRVSENSPVDNMASGNFAASIDMVTGKVDSPGVYGDMTKNDVEIHPVTGVEVIGFQVPFWPEIQAMLKEAALVCPDNRSIGWDVAVTKDGPELIEGNHDWCKLVWQLPVKQGLKPVLDSYLHAYQGV